MTTTRSFFISGEPSRVTDSGSLRETPGLRMKAVVTIMMMRSVSAMSMSGMRFISAIGSSSSMCPPCMLGLLLRAGLVGLGSVGVARRYRVRDIRRVQQRRQPRYVALNDQQHVLRAIEQRVIADDAWNRHKQSERRRAQRLRDAGRHRFAAQAALGHRLERYHDADDRPEQPDEGRGASDGRQDR